MKKGKELISFDRIIHELNWEIKPIKRPDMIDVSENGDMLWGKAVKCNRMVNIMFVLMNKCADKAM